MALYRSQWQGQDLGGLSMAEIPCKAQGNSRSLVQGQICHGTVQGHAIGQIGLGGSPTGLQPGPIPLPGTPVPSQGGEA
jgi:hypothetical protein